MIKNLGQVAAIYIGSSAPRNTNLIWLDNTVVPFVFRAYDGSAWSEIATHKWVRAYVDGWLVTLPPRQLADDGDYMLINSNNVNYKITVKDFVKSAVGNPLDFKGVIRVSADFPNPSTLESGDMYVIITSPAGGTVTDPYSGKTFEDSEKIVWDEVTQSWESLGKIDITVDLTTSYSETEVTIHSSAGKETTIQGATDQLAGVMLPGQYSWLQALSNGSIVPGDPSPLTPLTPAHKHNYNDIINRLVSQQGTGESTIDPMSQKATTDALNLKFDKASVLQVSGAATDKVMSQKAVTDALKTLSDDFNNKLTNYLPLSGGTMTGSIIFPNRKGIFGRLTNGTGNIKIAVVNANNNVEIGNSNTPLMLASNSTDLTHYRDNNTHKIWDAYNLPKPASITDLANYLPLAGGTLTGQLTIKQSVDIKLRLQSTDADNYCIIQAINSQASQLGVLGYAGDKWAIGHGGTYYEIWDKYNLTDPVTYTTNAYNHATLKNKDGQYFTYIKAGTNGLLPHSKATLASGGSGTLGTSDQSFNAAYINNLHINRVTFGETGPYITGSTPATQFLNAEGGVQKVATGGLYVGPSYASDALNLVPVSGIYSQGNIRTSGWLTFENNEWTDTGWTYKDAKGSIKVLSVINEANNKPTSYGSVLQFNSRQGHWCTQIWCDQTNVAGVIGTLRFRTTKSYNSTEWNPWTALVTEFDLNSYLTKTEASTLYYPYNGRGYLSITSTGKPVMSNNQGYAVKDKDGNEREVLWMGTDNTLNLGNTSQYTLNRLDLRCTTLTHNGSSIATQNYVTNQLSNYLPLTGGTLSGNLTINTVGSTTFVINNNDTNGSETFMRVLRKGTASAAIGFRDSLGAYIYNYNSGKYLFIDNNGDARVGTTNSSTKLALITDIPTVSGYLPLSGGTLTGALTMNSRRNNVVVDVIGGAGHPWDGGAGALSVQVPSDSGQTPLLLARRSGATINTTTLSERLLDMALLDTGTIFRVGMSGVNALELEVTSFTNKVGIGKLFGKQIATTDQIPSIPSISISNSGSGNAVTAISASGHTLTVTKGVTYLTSSALSGYATQSWANSQFAPLKNYFVTGSHASIATTGNEMCIGSLTSKNSIINVNYRNGTGITSPSTWYWRAGSSTSWANAYWGNLYMNDNLVATQIWASGQFPTKTGTGASGTWDINISGNATNATQLGGTAASSYVKANDNISRLTNDSGYATQSWANSQFAPLKNYFVTGSHASIATTGNEMCIGSLTSKNSIINVNYRNGTGITSPSTWYWRAGSSTSWANAYWGNLYMNDNLVATQIWASGQFPTKTGTGASGTWDINISGNATNATQLGGTAASSYVKANDNISRLTNDSGYATQEWVNSQNFVKSTSTKKVTDIQPVDALPATQASGVLYLVFG